jgi:hypothetical protein
LLKKKNAFFQALDNKILDRIFAAELEKIEKDKLAELNKKARQRSYKDEIVSLAVYQAIAHGTKDPDFELAERIREELIDHYKKHNRKQVRDINYTVETFMCNHTDDLRKNQRRPKSSQTRNKRSKTHDSQNVLHLANDKLAARSRSKASLTTSQCLLRASADLEPVTRSRSFSRYLSNTSPQMFKSGSEVQIKPAATEVREAAKSVTRVSQAVSRSSSQADLNRLLQSTSELRRE